MARPNILKDTEFQGLRGQIANFVESRYFTSFITVVIIINAITLGLETDKTMMAKHGDLLHFLDHSALFIFVVEILLKFYIYRFYFFRSGWNVFDFAIVSIAFIPATGPLAIMRSLRILRVLRLISVIPQMRRVIGALLHSIPGIASIMAVLLIIFYVAAVLVTTIYGPEFEMLFGTLGTSMYTLFQIMTLEGWSQEVVRPVMEVYPHSWMFFIPFIIITSFAVLNLFIGIIVDAMNTLHELDRIYTGPDRRKNQDDIKALKVEIAEIKELILKQSQENSNSSKS